MRNFSHLARFSFHLAEQEVAPGPEPLPDPFRMTPEMLLRLQQDPYLITSDLHLRLLQDLARICRTVLRVLNSDAPRSVKESALARLDAAHQELQDHVPLAARTGRPPSVARALAVALWAVWDASRKIVDQLAAAHRAFDAGEIDAQQEWVARAGESTRELFYALKGLAAELARGSQ